MEMSPDRSTWAASTDNPAIWGWACNPICGSLVPSRVDAASQFAIATTSNNTTNIDGLGVKAVCVVEPRTTPPSTTLLVLLNGDRLFRVTEGYASCDTLKQFAHGRSAGSGPSSGGPSAEVERVLGNPEIVPAAVVGARHTRLLAGAGDGAFGDVLSVVRASPRPAPAGCRRGIRWRPVCPASM